jgi:hypothetical protein
MKHWHPAYPVIEMGISRFQVLWDIIGQDIYIITILEYETLQTSLLRILHC